jgi:hypothetical protein
MSSIIRISFIISRFGVKKVACRPGSKKRKIKNGVYSVYISNHIGNNLYVFTATQNPEARIDIP